MDKNREQNNEPHGPYNRSLFYFIRGKNIDYE
jgi:hypothetical protein